MTTAHLILILIIFILFIYHFIYQTLEYRREQYVNQESYTLSDIQISNLECSNNDNMKRKSDLCNNHTAEQSVISRTHLITFAQDCCKMSSKRVIDSASKFNFKSKMIFSLNSISQDWVRKYKIILSAKRGRGYFMWKPRVIFEALLKADEDDIVLYLDAGPYIVADPTKLLSTADCAEIMVWCSPYLEESYTKKRTFEMMNATGLYGKNTTHRTAGIFVIKKSAKTMEFVQRWMSFAEDGISITDPEDKEVNSHLFNGHRHDQSIVSILTKQLNIACWRDPSQFGIWKLNLNVPGSYGFTINHLREREN